MTDYSESARVKVEIIDEVKITTFPTRAHKPIVEWTYPEFQCLCPVSSRHDQGKVVIKYLPDKNILESKSVRDYLASWRNKKIWQEYVTEEIANQLFKASKPKWLIVEIEWSGRGGISAKTISKRGEI